MLCLVPSAAPEGLQLVEKSSTSIIVKWKPIPANLTNGHLSGYKIKYKKIFSLAFSYLTRNSAPLVQANISDLEKSTMYEIYVAGFTEAGTGPYSSRFRAMTSIGESLGINVYYNSWVYIGYLEQNFESLPVSTAT